MQVCRLATEPAGPMAHRLRTPPPAQAWRQRERAEESTQRPIGQAAELPLHTQHSVARSETTGHCRGGCAAGGCGVRCGSDNREGRCTAGDGPTSCRMLGDGEGCRAANDGTVSFAQKAAPPQVASQRPAVRAVARHTRAPRAAAPRATVRALTATHTATGCATTASCHAASRYAVCCWSARCCAASCHTVSHYAACC